MTAATCELPSYDWLAGRFWFVRLRHELRWLHWPLDALAAALVPFIAAFAVAAVFGDAGLYLRSGAFYLGAGGVALVLAAESQSMRRLTAAMTSLETVAERPSKFRVHAAVRMLRAADWRSSGPWFALIALGAIAAITHALIGWHHGKGSSAAHFFPVQWRHHSELVPSILVLAIWTPAVVAVFATAVELLVRNLRFVWSLSREHYLPFPGKVRLHLRPLINVYTFTSASWGVGVALLAIFFVGNYNAKNVIGLALGVLIGLLTFIVPYWSCREILDRAHERMCEDICRAIEDKAGEHLSVEVLQDFAAANQAVVADPPPVLTRRGAVGYTVIQVIAFTSLFLKDTLNDQLKDRVFGKK